MVTRHARTIFGLCLAFAVLPLVATAPGDGQARAHAAMAWMQLQQLQTKSQSSAQTSRGVTDADAQHLAVTPFVPAAPVGPRLSERARGETPRASHLVVRAAPVTLHLARAPPALS